MSDKLILNYRKINTMTEIEIIFLYKYCDAIILQYEVLITNTKKNKKNEKKLKEYESFKQSWLDIKQQLSNKLYGTDKEN